MTEQERITINEDFRSWSGGFAPESDHEITVYIDYARPASSDPKEVRELLREWLKSGESGGSEE